MSSSHPRKGEHVQPSPHGMECSRPGRLSRSLSLVWSHSKLAECSPAEIGLMRNQHILDTQAAGDVPGTWPPLCTLSLRSPRQTGSGLMSTLVTLCGHYSTPPPFLASGKKCRPPTGNINHRVGCCGKPQEECTF